MTSQILFLTKEAKGFYMHAGIRHGDLIIALHNGQVYRIEEVMIQWIYDTWVDIEGPACSYDSALGSWEFVQKKNKDYGDYPVPDNGTVFAN